MSKLHADERAQEMRKNLETLTPEELGWPGMTPDELIASEMQCWLEEELDRVWNEPDASVVKLQDGRQVAIEFYDPAVHGPAAE